VQTSERPARVDPKALRAFLESGVGRETLRRELVEGTGVRAGQIDTPTVAAGTIQTGRAAAAGSTRAR